MADDQAPAPDDSVTPDAQGGATYALDDQLQPGEAVDTPDGGALVMPTDDEGEGDQRSEPNGEFFANLVLELTQSELQDLGAKLVELIDGDKQAREKRDKQYAEGIRRTGFTDDAPEGADFDGASRVQHPMIGKAAIDFASHAMKELFPPDGPVKDKIVGDVTAEKVARAKRKTEHMNWQLTQEIPEFRPSLEQLLSQVPIGGAQYLKIYADPVLQRPACEVVWIDHMLLPSNAASFLSARRRTIVMDVSKVHYQDKVDSGEWEDVDALETGIQPERTKAESANDKIEGVQDDPYNKDGIRTMYECYVWWELEGDELKPQDTRFAPYVITVDQNTNRVCAIYRNWDDERAQRTGRVRELQHLVEWPFIPWRGAYPIGLYHLVGQLTIAATGALRALLDSALINNSPGAIKIKGGLRGGQSQSINPTEVNELEASVNMDDIRKLAMPIPFNPPSSVLYQLLSFLGEQGADMVRTALEETDSGGANMPVGTAMARIEQGMIVFSAIHARLHAAMAQVLSILHRINGETLEDEVLKEDTGETLALRSDYEGPMDVVPVSDPNIFSEAQRFAQTQAIAQRGTGNPLYDQNKLEQRILDTLKIPNPDELLVTPPNPEPQDPVTENVGLSLGRPAVAFPNQDHVAHLGTHLAFALDPHLGANELVGPTLFNGMLQHVKEHLVLFYAKQMGDVVERAAGAPLKNLMSPNPQNQNSLAKAFLVGSRFVHEPQGELGNVFNAASDQAMKILDMAKKFAQQNQPQDPNMAMVQVQAQEVQRKGQADQVTAQLKDKELQLKAADTQSKTQLAARDSQRRDQELAADTALAQADLVAKQAETAQDRESAALEAQSAQDAHQLEVARVGQDQQRLEQERALGQMKLAVQKAMNDADNVMALKITLLELANDRHKASVSTGTGLGANPQPR